MLECCVGNGGAWTPFLGGPPPTPSFLWRGDHVGHGGRMSCPFGESSLCLFESGEFRVTMWVKRVAWASNKGILPSAPSVWAQHLIWSPVVAEFWGIPFWRGDRVGHGGCMGCLFGESSLHLFSSGEFGVAVWVMRVVWASDKGVLPSTPWFGLIACWADPY